MADVIQIKLPNGAVLAMEVSNRREVDVAGRLPMVLDNVFGAVEGLAEVFATSIKKIQPRKAVLEFGMEISAETGVLTAVIVKGEGKANLKLSLELS